MTRINLVPPRCLSTKHLLAEYRELPRVFKLAAKNYKHYQRPAGPRIPKEYCLGKGHVTFFYDKCEFLMRRWNAIREELKYLRNMKLSEEYISYVNDLYDNLPKECKNEYNYEPSPKDYYVNMQRLVERGFEK